MIETCLSTFITTENNYLSLNIWNVTVCLINKHILTKQKIYEAEKGLLYNKFV